MSDTVEEDLRNALEHAENKECKYYVRDALQKVLMEGPDHEYSKPDDDL